VSVLEGDNILNLWRFYGNDGWGVAIEFDIEFPGHSSMDCCFLGKVIYEKPNLEGFKEKNAAFEERHKIKVDVSKLIRVPACFHKSPYYKIEFV